MTDGGSGADGRGAGSPRVTRADVEDARDRLADVAHRTPVDTSRTFAAMSGAASLGLKLESFQRTGSFKIRGAYNAMAQLSAADREAGVITASAGNHAQGVALAGEILGVDATIVVPEVTPAAKIAATRGYGATVLVEGDIYERSYEFAADRAERTGETFVHPFDDEAVVAGQGTVGLELLEQYPAMDTVLVSIGGGGLISGIGTALAAADRDVRVVGVQPEGAAHAPPSLAAGEVRPLDDVDTVAEGIADTRMSETTFEIASEVVDDVVTVSDREIAAAVTLLAEREKVVAEGAGAAPLAAALSDAPDLADAHPAVVVSGANVNITEHAELARTGLFELGRRARARLALASWPARAQTVIETVAAEGAELESFERADPRPVDHPNRTPAEIGIEGRGADHLAGVLTALDELDGVSVVERSVSEE
ncbi:pyridoxal-phosphate dependent enzyme [Halorubrum sp. GN11_10-6_MGM]|uniref:threonine ammonia-lyase n=1 Tax=Halorubrum sp. GN11_10-6_MGM TaxID=2518112 RepID=UPI0010F92233|nr:threonine/serine dehydratase [Halorubrum sp. GN11_10-6_MGM]TKX74153.1 pyridoxal-phosphate dependent enzyme [Halorubrum sp. GN11_10-6_MGM]